MSVRLSASISASPTGRISVKFDIGDNYIKPGNVGVNVLRRVHVTIVAAGKQ